MTGFACIVGPKEKGKVRMKMRKRKWIITAVRIRV
jgi:hypothetical protein